MTRAGLRFALSHHPRCTVFASHVAAPRIVGRRVALCLGCLAFWPALMAGMPLGAALAAQAGWLVAVLVGGILVQAQWLSYTGLAQSRAARIATKATFGLGVAVGGSGVMAAPLALGWRVALLVALVAAAGAMQSLRWFRMQRQCDACPWQRDWANCPGFYPFNGYRPGARAPEGNAVGSWPSLWPPKD